MVIRPYKADDAERVKEIHAAQGYSFEFEPMDAKSVVSAWVAEHNGVVVSAVVARSVPEVTAYVDSSFGNPGWRLEIIRQLQEKGEQEMVAKGFTQWQAWVKAEISGFGRRLQRSLGWVPSKGGTCFVRGH